MRRISLSIDALGLLLNDTEACTALFAHWRWPRGFVCPHCESPRATRIARRPAWRCLDCRRQTRLTAGTAIHGSHLPLRHWIYAIFGVAQRKTSVSAKQLERDLNVAYATAWFMLQRIRRFLAETPTAKLRRGRVEIASFKLGEVDARPHPSTEDTCPTSDIDTVVIGIERLARDPEKPQLRFGRLRAIAVPSTMPAQTLVDLRAASSARLSFIPRPIARVIQKNFVDWLRGVFHGVSRKHLAAYLGEQVFRFNRRRRVDLLPSFVGRRLARGLPLARASLRTTPPGVDLLVRSHDPQVPRELTADEQDNARIDAMFVALFAQRDPHADPRVLIKKLVGPS